MTDKDANRLEVVIGNLLRFGVALAGLVVAAGAAVYLSKFGMTSPHYGHFSGEPQRLTTIPGVVAGAMSFDGRSIIQLGLLLLIATPIARVLFSLLAFLRDRDWLYSLFTLIVLSVLAYSLLAK